MIDPESRCWFCNRPTPDGEIVCHRERCQEFDRELKAALDEKHRADVRAGMRAAIKQRAKCDENWQLNRIERWFYTVKLFVCIFLRLSYRGEKYYPGSVEVGVYPNDWHWPPGGSVIEVGYGVFSGWWWSYFNE